MTKTGPRDETNLPCPHTGAVFRLARLILPLVILTWTPVRADTLVLTNGTRIDNVAVWREGDMVYCLRFGAVIGYPSRNVATLEPGPVDEEANRENPGTDRDDGTSSVPRPDQTPTAPPSPEDSADRFHVIRIYDGDTFRAKGHGVEVTVRVAAIDAPETGKKDRPGQPLAKEAREALSRMVVDRDVRIEGYGLDRYRRQIAEVFVDGLNVGLELARLGLATLYTGKPPEGLDMDAYHQAEAEAQRLGRGMWEPGRKTVSPSEWRKRHPW